MTFLIDALAVARLTRLVTKDAITSPVRDAIEARSVKMVAVKCISSSCSASEHQTESGDVQPWAFLRDLTDCGWCSSFWLAAGVVTARKVAPRAWTPIAYGLALAAVAGWLTNRDDT